MKNQFHPVSLRIKIFAQCAGQNFALLKLLIPLNKICAKEDEQLTLFSKDLMVSKNYARTSAYQKQFINVLYMFYGQF